MDTMRNPANALFDRMEANWPEAATRQMATAVAIQRLARLVQENARQCAAIFDLTFTEFEVLAAMRSFPEAYRLTPTELSGTVLMFSGSLTKVLRNLEVRGLILRPESKDDEQSCSVMLTTAGRVLVERVMSAVQKSDEHILRGITETTANYCDLKHMLIGVLSDAERVNL